MAKLHVEFVNTFLNSFEVLDFHRVSLYTHAPATELQKTTIKKKQLNFIYLFVIECNFFFSERG